MFVDLNHPTQFVNEKDPTWFLRRHDGFFGFTDWNCFMSFLFVFQIHYNWKGEHLP